MAAQTDRHPGMSAALDRAIPQRWLPLSFWPEGLRCGQTCRSRANSTLEFEQVPALQAVCLPAQPMPCLFQSSNHLRLQVSAACAHLIHPGLPRTLSRWNRPASTCPQMFDPLREVPELGVIFSDPAIDLETFRVPT